MKRTRILFRKRAAAIKRIAPRLRVCLLVGDPDDFPEERNFAMCGLVRPEIAEVIVAPKIEDEPDAVIDALLRHELAHAVLLYRGQRGHSERDADAFAEVVWGDRINYDDREVQTLAPGQWPRPWHLPR